jgi:hypothetical protein
MSEGVLQDNSNCLKVDCQNQGLILMVSLSQTTWGGLKFFYIFQCQELGYETV